MTITPIYAALAAFLFVFLSARVIRVRRSHKIALGDADNIVLRRAMRVQGNFAEYAPLALILIAFAEMQGGSAWAIHVLGAALLIGRLIHASGLGREPEPANLRVIGMAFTLTVIIVAGLTNLVLAFQA